MSKTLILMTIAAMQIVLVACAPWPYEEHQRPTVVGRLVDDGHPIHGAEVFLGATPGTNQPCQDAGETIQVSPTNGSFRITARSQQMFMRSLLNPPSLTGRVVAVCIRRPGFDVQIGALLFMFTDKPTSVEMNCDVSITLGRNELGSAQTSSPLGQPQLCQAMRVPQNAGYPSFAPIAVSKPRPAAQFQLPGR